MHNPTNAMVKPFALLCVVLFVDIMTAIEKNEESIKKSLITFSILLAVSVLAKPSFFQEFIPAAGLYLIAMWIKGKCKYFLRYFFVCVSFLPGLAIVIYQFAIAFFYSETSGGIGFGWLDVFGAATPNAYISFLLVVAFALCYTLLFFKETIKKKEIQFAWFFTIIGWLEAAVLYEQGFRMYDGNFTWSVQLGYFVLWVIILIDYAKRWKSVDYKLKINRI